MPDVKVEISAVTTAAESAMKRFEAGMEGIFRRILAAASVTALAAFAGKLVNTADELYKMSQRVGIAVESLSAFRGIARLANIDASELQISLKTAAQQLVNASQGGKEATAAFESLRISVRNADGSLKSLDQLLLDVAEQFADMPDGVRKTDAAVAIFGRSGERLIPLLNQGRGGIQDLIKEMRELGIVISTDTARQADELNDTIVKLTMALEGLGNRVLAQLLPGLLRLAKAMLDVSKNSEAAQEKANDIVFALRAFASAVFISAEVINQFMRSLALFVVVGKEVAGAVLTAMKNAFKEFAQAVGDAAGIMANFLTGNFAGAAASAASLNKNVQDLVGGHIKDLKESVQRVGDVVAGMLEGYTIDLFHEMVFFQSIWDAIWDKGNKDPRPKGDERKPGTNGSVFDGGVDPEAFAANVEKYKELWEDFVADIDAEKQQSVDAQKKSQRELEIDLMESQRRIRKVLSRDDLTREEKQRLVAAQMREEIETVELLKGAYKALAEDKNETTEVQLMAMERLQNLNEEQLRLVMELRDLYKDTFGATMTEGITKLADQWSAVGANLADTVLDGIKAAVQGVADAIMGAIDGTKTWGQVFAQVGRSIIASLIQVVVQWIASMTVVKLLKKIFQTEENVAAAQSAAAWGPAAVAASIASYGAAAAVGTSAAIAGMSAGAVAGAALGTIGSFEKGGRVRGGRQLIQVNERGEEFVSNAAATARFGHILERMNDVALTQPIVSTASVTSGSEFSASPAQVHIVQVYNEQDLLRVLQSKMGEQIVVTHIKNNKNEVGIQS
jgi:hypothetical protein